MWLAVIEVPPFRPLYTPLRCHQARFFYILVEIKHTNIHHDNIVPKPKCLSTLHKGQSSVPLWRSSSWYYANLTWEITLPFFLVRGKISWKSRRRGTLLMRSIICTGSYASVSKLKTMDTNIISLSSKFIHFFFLNSQDQLLQSFLELFIFYPTLLIGR